MTRSYPQCSHLLLNYYLQRELEGYLNVVNARKKVQRMQQTNFSRHLLNLTNNVSCRNRIINFYCSQINLVVLCFLGVEIWSQPTYLFQRFAWWIFDFRFWNVVFTDHVRITKEGNVFTGSVQREGGGGSMSHLTPPLPWQGYPTPFWTGQGNSTPLPSRQCDLTPPLGQDRWPYPFPKEQTRSNTRRTKSPNRSENLFLMHVL